jgi:integrase/recombinase XerD
MAFSALKDLVDDFLNSAAQLGQLRPSTLKAYRLELFAAASDETFQVPLAELTLSILEAWIARPPAAPSTQARRAATFNTFFEWAIRHDRCAHNPLASRAPIRTQRRLPRPIQHQTERNTLDRAIASAPMPYRLVFIILRETGMRVGEAINLRIGDVNLDPGRETLRIREPKNHTERMIVLGSNATPHTLRALRAYMKALPSREAYEPLFRSNRGTKLSYDAVHYQWRQLCTQVDLTDSAGDPLYTIHQLRHTHGSELLAQGQRIEIVQRVLGHRDIRSTLAYAELTEAQVRAALEDVPKR